MSLFRRKVVALSVGSFFSAISGFLLSAACSRYLTIEDYATVRQGFLVYEFLIPIILLGLPSALYYFLPLKNNSLGLVIDSLGILVITSLLFALLLLGFDEKSIGDFFNNKHVIEIIPYIAIYPLISVASLILPPVLVFADKIKILSAFNTTNSLVVAIFGIYAAMDIGTYQSVVESRMIGYLVIMPLAIYLLIHFTEGIKRLPRYDEIQNILKYSIPLATASTFGVITIQLHSLIVATMCDPEDFAIYVNGAIELPIIGIVTANITAVLFGEMAKECAAKNYHKVLELFKIASTKSACIIFPTAVFFLINAENLMVFMYGNQYSASSIPFMLYLAILPSRIVVYGAAMMALGMQKKILLRSIVDLVLNLVLSIILVRYIGAIGAVLGLIITLYLWTIPYNLRALSETFGVKSHLILPFRDLFQVLRTSVIFSIPVLFIELFIVDTNGIIKIVSGGLIYALLIGYSYHRTGVLIIFKKRQININLTK